MNIFFHLFLFASTLFAKEPAKVQFQEYQEMMRSYSSSIGLTGDAAKGEIELLSDPEKIAIALENTGRDVGIVYQDKYWIWINDPVQFPNGTIGVYGRILSRSSLKGFAAGTACVPYFKDGRIALVCQFRHATRSWELEIPRGFTEEGETLEESARREILEETGLIVKDFVFLGKMAPDAGKVCSVVPIFMAIVQGQTDASPEDSEAIASTVILTIDELREGLCKGSISMEIQGEKRQVFLRDPFLTYALVQMDIRKVF